MLRGLAGPPMLAGGAPIHTVSALDGHHPFSMIRSGTPFASPLRGMVRLNFDLQETGGKQ
jgi:hypothetical protein